MKSKQELIEKWESAIEEAEFYGKGKEERLISYMKDFVSDLNQLDEPEVTLDEPEILSQEWVHENKEMYLINDTSENAVPAYKLQNLFVPKQEEVDRAYKDGYEKGKEYTFYKGYLEGLADKEKEPETVASVIADFYKSFERFKEVISMEVEELEE